eukprot:CAMPEP_0206042470 /NCGR_PEP_ID=MMETSP1466-20131121/6571_1 /ASSEMBLY_ACC=CAM_ASM_001126 /TAXON_ID=44452 /ORGANISM="Pavlova gyrans, Strain CCMP608" /LENGTH=270 /DNA_ID=CAMNT_0053417179 /DNA_START=756 /DNA_END=1570 /DNA_ORIENTATION=+
MEWLIFLTQALSQALPTYAVELAPWWKKLVTLHDELRGIGRSSGAALRNVGDEGAPEQVLAWHRSILDGRGARPPSAAASDSSSHAHPAAMRRGQTDKDSRTTSAPAMRMSMLSLGKKDSKGNSPSGTSGGPKRPPVGSSGAQSSGKLDLPASRPQRASDSNVTAKDLAPTDSKTETSGEATQGDFLMAAKARRRKLADEQRAAAASQGGGGGGLLDDTCVHSPMSFGQPSQAPPPRRKPGGGGPSPPPPSNGGLGDIDIPTSMPRSAGR